MLQCLDPKEGREFRDFFRDSGYTTQALQKRFGSTEIPQLHLLKLLAVGIPLEPSRLNILFRWFWIGTPVDLATANQFIPDRMMSLFLKSGVLTMEYGSLQSTVRISPFAEYLILSDHAVITSGALMADTIVWPSPTTLLCYYLSIQAPVGRTLDLGTGNGILALASASHSATVVATDLNPRAREFCLFNAALNGLSNLEFREGNAFEPVQGERFDLILANPPFFVTPSVRHIYSDNSMELDGFCRTLVRQAPEHLNENGYCQMMVEWVQLYDQPWHDRLTEWFERLGCDVWVLATYMRSAADYALIRVQEHSDEFRSREDQAARTSEWHTYFVGNRVESVYGGIIVLRKRQGRNWIRIEEVKSMPMRPFGEFLRRTFENRDVLEQQASDEQLLATRPVLPPSARLQKQFAISPEGWKLTSVELHLGEGLPYSLVLQPQVGDFVALFDGNKTLAEIADLFAATLGVDPALMRRESCAITRKLADCGMIHFEHLRRKLISLLQAPVG
jgi:methylase of polypeptide subunit release factors